MNFDFSTKLLKKNAPTKAAPIKKKMASKPAISRPAPRAALKTQKTVTKPLLRGGAGYRKYEGDSLWLPNTTRPAWLDGSLPGDRGFDPLGLAKPVEYLQFDLDQLDQNQAQNRAGGVVGSFKPETDELTSQSLQPYSEVFGLQRFRECELIHGRWAMLATLGIIVAESATGVSWVDAGKIELDGARYLNFDLPFSISQLCWIEALAVGGAELYRNSELDSQKRIYPGGVFDPLGLATVGKADKDQIARLREAEIKHGRLAMVSFFGFGIQALTVGEGAMGSLAKFSSTL
jgi:light-harvesting complex II chlorophyll a/b binding protein 4